MPGIFGTSDFVDLSLKESWSIEHEGRVCWLGVLSGVAITRPLLRRDAAISGGGA
jgi:hypothetical protein